MSNTSLGTDMGVYRKLLPAEIDRYEAHLLRLDDADRHSRFAGPTSSETIKAHCQKLDMSRTILIGCFDRGELHGACELLMLSNGSSHRAEAAFSVEKKYQGQGIGRELMERALVIARNRHIQLLDVMCLLSNRRMQALTRYYGPTVEIDCGEVFMTVNLKEPDQVSQALEMFDDGAGMITTLLDRLTYPGKAHVPFHGWSA